MYVPRSSWIKFDLTWSFTGFSSVGPIGLKGESDSVFTPKRALQCELSHCARRTETVTYIVLGRKQLCCDRTQDSSTLLGP
jgi:hypothetical protein